MFLIGFNQSIDVTKMERSEPIGAEQDDDEESVLSLEQILQSNNQSFSTKSESPSNINNSELNKKIQILEKKVEHQRNFL